MAGAAMEESRTLSINVLKPASYSLVYKTDSEADKGAVCQLTIRLAYIGLHLCPCRSMGFLVSMGSCDLLLVQP